MADGERILVTGGAGFIGSNFVRDLLAHDSTVAINVDKLTYAGSLASLVDLQHDPRHIFVRGDIGDFQLMSALLREHRPWAIVNFAAESHVDRSIHGPEDFVQTNVVGSFRLLEAARGYWQGLTGAQKDAFRFIHVSTDEVYGSLSPADPAFGESTRYAPNSPYSASKAASDHFVRAYFHTYGLPTLTTNCSNNYGPYQFPEKLIPLMILNGVEGKPLPVYGDGGNVRDWLYVADHCDAIRQVLRAGRPGETYNIGGNCELTNIEVVRAVCELLDKMRPRPDRKKHAEQITFISDRPGHDRRYAIDIRKIESQLGWRPRTMFKSALSRTVEWYLENGDWVKQVHSDEHRRWLELNYRARQ